MNLMKKGELLEEYSQDTIQSRILTIRGQQVIMDADLADTRKQLDDQLKPLDEAWLKFSTA